MARAIRVLTCVSGLDFLWNHGDVVVVDDETAAGMIAHGYAEAAEERAAAPAARAERRSRRPRVAPGTGGEAA